RPSSAPSRSLEHHRGYRRQKELADEEDDQKQDDGGYVDAAQVRQVTPYRLQRRIGHPEEHVADHSDDLVARIDDVERVKPGKDGGAYDDPPIDIERQDDRLNECQH